MLKIQISQALGFLNRCFRQCRLLFTNPHELLNNIQQFTKPDAFRNRLLDMVSVSPLTTNIIPGKKPTLNVLLPRITPGAMTGGPNTVLNIGYHIAASGVPVCFISCDVPIPASEDWFWHHLGQLTGIAEKPADVELQSAYGSVLRIGADDLIMASYWTTAYQAAELLRVTKREMFLYLIQDFEPAFYPWSSNYALEMETYSLPFHGIINESTLADHLFSSRLGHFADPIFRTHCTVFEPALDRRVFYPPKKVRNTAPRRLLLYARPTTPRNMLGMAVAALKSAIETGVFENGWEFLTLGARGSLPDIPLGTGRVLRSAPWRDYAGYADLLRTSDILLCPMLSPHTSYPVIEMVACGGLAVTNVFSTKTAERLATISTNIIAVAPTIKGFADGVSEGVRRLGGGRLGVTKLAAPATWDESLDTVFQMVRQKLHATV